MSHVDSTSPVTHVSLCAGYGGIDLGLHRAIPNLRTIAVSEIEAFACANLVAKMEAGLLDPHLSGRILKPSHGPSFVTAWTSSLAATRASHSAQPASDSEPKTPRHLWPFISAGIAAMRPSVCFFENVEGHISLGLSDVIEDLDRLGYRATWCVASASECGAPHQRKRVFILAYDQRRTRTATGTGRQASSWSKCLSTMAVTWRDGRELANAGRSSIRERAWSKSEISSNNHACGQVLGQAWPSRPGEQQFAWEPPRVGGHRKCKTASTAGRIQRPTARGICW
jgi:DNA (cytosine-5)-methyltransferase 1